MKTYPKIGIRPTIDGRQGGIRESLEDKTMNLAKAVKNLIESNLHNGDGSPVECVISDTTIGRVAESAACAEKFERDGVGATITVTSCAKRFCKTRKCGASRCSAMSESISSLVSEVKILM